MIPLSRLLLLCLILFPLSLAAQPSGQSDPGTVRWDARLQSYFFKNFFYSSDPLEQENTQALGAELRGAFRPGARPLEIYGHLNGITYGVDRVSDSFGLRIGLASDGDRHRWNVFLDQAENRPSFEVGNSFARADVTTLAGESSWRVSQNWEVAGEAALERQRHNVRSTRENHYYGAGGSIRYRGLGWRFTPEAGVVAGRREVKEEEESYETADPYVRLTWMPPVPDDRLWMSLRYRDRSRSYTIRDRQSRNFGREENRGAWTFNADWRAAPRLSVWTYYSTESVHSSLPAGDFDVGLLLLGVTFRFGG